MNPHGARELVPWCFFLVCIPTAGASAAISIMGVLAEFNGFAGSIRLRYDRVQTDTAYRRPIRPTPRRSITLDEPMGSYFLIVTVELVGN